MLYRQDSHSAPTLYLASKSRIDIPVPEDFTHAFVQIRVTGPGGDGTPAEVHIVRNSGMYTRVPRVQMLIFKVLPRAWQNNISISRTNCCHVDLVTNLSPVPLSNLSA